MVHLDLSGVFEAGISIGGGVCIWPPVVGTGDSEMFGEAHTRDMSPVVFALQRGMAPSSTVGCRTFCVCGVRKG